MPRRRGIVPAPPPPIGLPLVLAAALCGACGPAPARDRLPAAPSNEPPAAETSSEPGDDHVLTDAEIEAIVHAPDCEPGDVESDARRKPVELLRFLRLRRGMKVADIGAGFGYTTELLARAVGPTGVVYGQNPPFVLERFADKGWSQRLAKPVMATVIRLDRPFDDPFPDDVRGLDLVINVLFYHDFEWQGVDREAHDRDVLAALRPGGRYVIVDASAAAGAGTSVGESLHRIEQSVVEHELEAAGFELVDHADFLRNPDDTRDWNSLPWRNDRGDEYSDKFVLAFARPR